jgi:hypothetical protein
MSRSWHPMVGDENKISERATCVSVKFFWYQNLRRAYVRHGGDRKNVINPPRGANDRSGRTQKDRCS